MSDSLDGVPPEGVTNIVVEDTVVKVRSNNRVTNAVAAGSVTVAYTLKVYDAALTVAKLRNKLVQSTSDGTMDTKFRHYAVMFNVTSLNNGSFAEPLVTSAAAQRDSSERLTGAMIALVVVGVLVGLALLVGGLLFVYYRQDSAPAAVPHPVELQQV